MLFVQRARTPSRTRFRSPGATAAPIRYLVPIASAALALAACSSSGQPRQASDARTGGRSAAALLTPTTAATLQVAPVAAQTPAAPPVAVDDIVLSHLPIQPIVGGVRTSAGTVLAGADGGVFALSHSLAFTGSMSGRPLSGPVVAVAADPAGAGYWLAGADGGVFAFNRPFFGPSALEPLSQPVTAMAATPSGQGYWLAGKDGGVFAYGDAPYLGGMVNRPLSAPTAAIASTPSGHGYWLAAADGGVFAFGDASFLGSPSSADLMAPVVGILPTQSGRGYWLAAADGGVFAYGDAPFLGAPLHAGRGRVVAITAAPDGYRLVTERGALLRPNEQPVPDPLAQAAPNPDLHQAASTVSRSARRTTAPAAAAPAPARQVAPARPAAPVVTVQVPSGSAIVAAINAVRAQYGLQPLAMDSRLTSLAGSWSVTMSRSSLHHNNLSGLISQWSSYYSMMGENIYAGPGGAASAVVTAWMNSAPHRAEILNGSYNRIGAGAASANGVVFATADFATAR
jgi:uncharacterized protein YkwD